MHAGASERVVVVGAHYDTQATGPGAWDNGSGVAALLALAEAIAAEPTRDSIRFVAFGVEEQGMWGSMAFVAAHSEEVTRTTAMVNLDTVGAAMNGSRLLCSSPALRALACETAIANGWRPDRFVDATDMPWFDHGSFELAGVPVACLLQDVPKHPYYHTAGDVTRYLDMRLMSSAARASAALVGRLANEDAAAS
jgi:aminopeptidase YwaD